MTGNNYNTQGSKEEEEKKEEGPVDQTENNDILDKETRIDANEGDAGDPELKWREKWKLKGKPDDGSGDTE
jgi:hypothetical protein